MQSVDPIVGLKIWEKQDYETDREYSIFRFWLEQDHPRSLDVAAQRHFGHERTSTGKLVTIDSSAMKAYLGFPALDRVREEPGITWEERARAWDLHTQKQELIDRQAKRNVVKRREYDTAMKLMSKAAEMLEWPIYTEQIEEEEDGSVTIVRLPAKWSIRDVSGMVKTASELARLSTDMEQGHYKFTLNLTLSPDAIEALNFLEQFDVRTEDIMREYENVIIETAQEYARDRLGLAAPGDTIEVS
jgi:hypothetical protein